MISVTHAIPRMDVLLGIVRAERIIADVYPSELNESLDGVLRSRREGLAAAEELRRRAGRDMLRNGVYKPTGRAKPASEYLLRAAEEGAFPRINAPVDICNFLSLKHVIPISIWDLDLSEASRFVFRLGRAGERYVFNEGGQVIDVEDLLVGCRVRGEGSADGEPIVNPVKDCLVTKTTQQTTRVAACVYAPVEATTATDLENISAEFAELLSGGGPDVQTAYAVLKPGETIEL
jgi:DNA/RNA-binding domain of Phe-tRNA-synthetase-like protein